MFHQKSCFYQKPCFYQKLCFHPSHLKVPIELLYLESSTIPLNYILAGRRINYLHNILIRDNTELEEKSLQCTEGTPTQGVLV